MGDVRVTYKDDCDVVVGAQPDGPDQPIQAPKKVGRTNETFMMADGLHCFSIVPGRPFTPLWQTGQVTPVRILELSFK
jgi:hypothetical protein